MTDQEKIIRYQDLLDFSRSKGFQWQQKKLDAMILDNREKFLLVPLEDDLSRLEIQISMKMLREFRDWVGDEISRFQSMEKMKAHNP